MAAYNYGGQAVIEGVMMRGQRAAAVAVRAPEGNIVLHEEALASGLYASPAGRWPFIRGIVLLWDMLVLGTRMMLLAASIAVPQDATSAAAPAVADRGAHGASPIVELRGTGNTDARLIPMLLLSLTFAVGIFFILPVAASGAAAHWVGSGWGALAFEGALRLALLIGYLALIGRMPDIQRVFQYHGAEHKTINCYESGQPLDVVHVRRASRVHTRCGTGFLLIVVVVSIFVFAFLGTPALLPRLLSRIVLVPVIAAIAYELMRLGAANYRYRVVRWLLAPSLALQGLTTREPDDGQIECAIVALRRVQARDGLPVLETIA